MSIITFIAGLWAAISKLWKKLPAELKAAVHVGISLVENIKAFIDSPVADILTAIIPGDLDDQLKIKLRRLLPIWLQAMRLADATLDVTDPQAIMQTALQSIRELDPLMTAGVYHQLSILIAQVAADGKLNWSDGVVVLEWVYNNQYKPAA